MAAKKRIVRKRGQSKTAPRKKSKSAKKAAGRKKAASKQLSLSRKPASGKKAATPTRAARAAASKSSRAGRKKVREGDLTFGIPSREELEEFPGEQSGDLQGLSRRERADSESVDELLEEGNAFEADAVSGVEEADNTDEREVHTHEVPEDDVPGEYLDKD